MDANGLEAAGPVRIITTEFGAEIYSFDVAQPVRKDGRPTGDTAKLEGLKPGQRRRAALQRAGRGRRGAVQAATWPTCRSPRRAARLVDDPRLRNQRASVTRSGRTASTPASPAGRRVRRVLGAEVIRGRTPFEPRTRRALARRVCFWTRCGEMRQVLALPDRAWLHAALDERDAECSRIQPLSSMRFLAAAGALLRRRGRRTVGLCRAWRARRGADAACTAAHLRLRPRHCAGRAGAAGNATARTLFALALLLAGTAAVLRQPGDPACLRAVSLGLAPIGGSADDPGLVALRSRCAADSLPLRRCTCHATPAGSIPTPPTRTSPSATASSARG